MTFKSLWRWPLSSLSKRSRKVDLVELKSTISSLWGLGLREVETEVQEMVCCSLVCLEEEKQKGLMHFICN